MKKYSIIIASLAVLFLSGCFYSHTERVVPVQPTVTPPAGQTTSRTTTTTTANNNGKVQRRSTTTYSGD